MTELLTEEATDLITVGLARAEGFATGVQLRCEMKVAENTTRWLQHNHQEEAEMVSPTCQEKNPTFWKQS